MLQRLKMLVSPFLGYRPDELPAPLQSYPTDERNHQIAEAIRAGGTFKEVAAIFGVTPNRVRQVLNKAVQRQSRALKIPLGIVHNYYRPRKAGAKGDKYTSASSPAQWAALAEWERAAQDVADAQEEADVDWASVRWELDHRKKVNEAHRLRAKERAERNAIPDAAVVEIVRIKGLYDSLEATEKLIRKDELAAQIDVQLAILREYGRTYP